MQRPLYHPVKRYLHIVAEVIKAELVVCAVRYIAGILVLALVTGRIHVRLNRAHGHPQRPVNRSHPLRVALGQVIVDRNYMNPSSGQVHKVGRQCRHQGLTLAGGHLGNLAVIKDVAADKLHIEMPHLDVPPGRFANHRKDFR